MADTFMIGSPQNAFTKATVFRYLDCTRARITRALCLTVPTTASCLVVWALVTPLHGCAPGDPAWAMDVLHVAPDSDGVVVTQSWSLFDARWERGQRASRFVCSVLVVHDGVPTEPCPSCDVSWTLTQTLRETDCPRGSLREVDVVDLLDAVGVGTRPAGDPPVPKARGGYVRYLDGWEEHGWAWPEGAPQGRAEGGPWDGERSFELWPRFVWELQTGDTTELP
jgi:hypothetical protein